MPLRGSSPGSGTSYRSPPLRPHPIMSPETALVEFISTSASFHGVRKQNLRRLEEDLRKVFDNNIMPANAAAWYMGKKRFYDEVQLLPTILKNYPKRFAISGNAIEFLDSYKPAVAVDKLKKMVRQGLVAYFTHKMDDYGVYFFDPYYYETTEPFLSSFRQVLGLRGPGTIGGKHGNMTKKFFAQHKEKFVFQPVNEFLVTISREPVEVRVNVTCVISSMVDNQYGTLSFAGDGDSVTKAHFSAKSLYKDGYQYNGDPRDLPHMYFDGYRMPTKSKGGKPSWVAVLVWSGKKPSPRFCANKVDLYAGSHHLQNEMMLPTHLIGGANNNNAVGTDNFSSGDKSGSDLCMQVGQVMTIRDRGALVSLRKDSEERAYIPGWLHANAKTNVDHLVTTQGVELTMGDLITFYIDPKAKPVRGCKAVGCNVMVLKHEDKPGRQSVNSTSENDKKKAKRGRNRKMSSKSAVSTDGEAVEGRKKKDKVERKKRMSYRDYLLKADPAEDEDYNSEEDETVVFADLDAEISDEEMEENELQDLLRDLDKDVEAISKVYFEGMSNIEKTKQAGKEELAKANEEAAASAAEKKDEDEKAPTAEERKKAAEEKAEKREKYREKILRMREELSERIEKELEKMFGKPITEKAAAEEEEEEIKESSNDPPATEAATTAAAEAAK